MASTTRKRKREPQCQISRLSDELLGRIMVELSVRDRIRIERVSKRWRRVTKAFAWSALTVVYTTAKENEHKIEAVLDRCGDCSRIRELHISNSVTGRLLNEAVRSVIGRCPNLDCVISITSPFPSKNTKENVGSLLKCICESEALVNRLKSLQLDSVDQFAIYNFVTLLNQAPQLETLKVRYDGDMIADRVIAPATKQLRVLDIRDNAVISGRLLASKANCSALAANLRALRVARWDLSRVRLHMQHRPLQHLNKLRHLRYLGALNYDNRWCDVGYYVTPLSQTAILDAVECMPELRALELCGYHNSMAFYKLLPVRFNRAAAVGGGPHPLEHLMLDMDHDTPAIDAMQGIFASLTKLTSVDLKARWPAEMDWSWIENVALRGALQYVSIRATGDTLQAHREALVQLACLTIKECPALRYCDVGTSIFTPSDIKLLAEAAKQAEESRIESLPHGLPTITLGEKRYPMRQRKNTTVATGGTEVTPSTDTSSLIPTGSRLKFGPRQTSPIVSKLIASLS